MVSHKNRENVNLAVYATLTHAHTHELDACQLCPICSYIVERDINQSKMVEKWKVLRFLLGM